MKYTKEIGKKLLECLPEEYVAVACSVNGICFISKCVPKLSVNIWEFDNNNYIYFKYDPNPDWKKSLVIREKWIPEEDEQVFLALVDREKYYAVTCYVDSMDRCALERNLIFRTKEEAIKRAKEMLGEVK